jgi:hypothetical protein
MDSTTQEEIAMKDKDTVEVITMCHYNETCSKKKLCGDCAADEYERDTYEEALENYNLDRKMENY